jgi:hypothetical protein
LHVVATGWVSFARVRGRTFSADGDDWSTPPDFPAPNCRKHSLILKFGGGPWLQGGTDKTIDVPSGESGEVIFRTNDHDAWLWDNDGEWQVGLTLTRPDPPPPLPRPPTPTLAITDIEVVQAIQRAGNSVRLVQGKRTLVRVFVDSGLRSGEIAGAGPNEWPGVTGSLTVSDLAGNAIATLQPIDPQRRMTARSGEHRPRAMESLAQFRTVAGHAQRTAGCPSGDGPHVDPCRRDGRQRDADGRRRLLQTRSTAAAAGIDGADVSVGRLA